MEMERARRNEGALTLLVGDLDHFKQLNDRLGHPAGDRALELLGECLTAGVRRIDRVGPHGRRGVRARAAGHRRAPGVRPRRAPAQQDPRELRRGHLPADDLVRPRHVPEARRDHIRAAEGRRPGALHRQGVRPRLLRDLQRGDRRHPAGPARPPPGIDGRAPRVKPDRPGGLDGHRRALADGRALLEADRNSARAAHRACRARTARGRPPRHRQDRRGRRHRQQARIR